MAYCARFSGVAEWLNDGLRVEPTLEEMPNPIVARVVALRVPEIQEVHAVGQSFELCVNDRVVVVSHQAVAERVPSVAVTGFAEQRQEVPPLRSLRVQREAAYAPVHDVVNGAGELNT